MVEKQPILVAIHCLVYNQEPYLRDCFEGFVKQQTNFRYVAIVHDDCSTDGSAAIIKEYSEKYPDIFIPIIETENQWSKADGSIYRIMNEKIDATGAKYVAYCEGDDYWIDPHKLQKQVDILEADETLMMCCTNCSVVDNHSQTIHPVRPEAVVKDNKEGRYTIRDFFRDIHQYPTPTVVIRNVHKEEVREKFEHTKNKWLGDWTMWICLLIYGDMYYIDEVTAAYRVNPTSITHTQKRVERAKAHRDICLKVADIMPEEYADIAANLRDTSWVWIALLFAYKAEKRYLGMMGSLLMACITCPKALWETYQKSRKKS
jgi:glycosyltransferase involved in cell wall biosynthesis